MSYQHTNRQTTVFSLPCFFFTNYFCLFKVSLSKKDAALYLILHALSILASFIISSSLKVCVSMRDATLFLMLCSLSLLSTSHPQHYRQQTVTLPPTDLVLKVRVSTMGQQQGAELSAALLSRLVERSEAPPVRCIHCCLESDEQGGDVQVSVR